MADLFPYSVGFVLSNETFTRKGVVISLYPESGHPDPITGEISNFGISLAFLRGVNPQVTAADIRALTQETSSELYRSHFWNPAHLNLLTLPTVAARVLDAEVNMGSTHGVRLLQQATGVPVDGILGPATAAACNAAPELKLYAEFVACAKERYQEIHAAQVGKYGQAKADQNLSAWMARLAKTPPQYIPQ